MLGIDLYKEALLKGESSIYAGKEYKVKGDTLDSSTFFIWKNDIVRDDFSSILSLNLQWVTQKFFISELEEVSNHILDLDTLLEKLEKLNFWSKGVAPTGVGIICTTRAEISLICKANKIVHIASFNDNAQPSNLFTYMQGTKDKSIVIYHNCTVSSIHYAERGGITTYTFSELVEA